MNRKSLVYILVAAIYGIAAGPSYANAPSFTAQVSIPQTILYPYQRQAMGLPNFPDGSPAIIWNGTDYVFFAAQGGADNSPLSGTVRLVGPLASPSVNPADAIGSPIPSIRPGFLDPVPGTNFDLNYAGGGTVYFDDSTKLLLQIYHGEFDLGDPPTPATFYTTLGLAISDDLGKTFKKVGPVIAPNLPMSAGRTAASSSGSLVLRDNYLYLYYSDIDASGQTICAQTPCVAVARALVADVVSAAKKGKVAPWSKYYNGAFTEPGMGGKFTPLFVPESASVWARWPDVEFNEYTQSYIMTYAAGTDGGITLRESVNGISWSDPLYIFPAATGHSINYPGVASETLTPHILEKQFWVYYRDYPSAEILDNPSAVANSNWNRILVTLDKDAGSPR